MGSDIFVPKKGAVSTAVVNLANCCSKELFCNFVEENSVQEQYVYWHLLVPSPDILS